MDEGDEVYINGERVGQTGIPDEGGRYDGTNPWDVERVYGSPDRLLKAGTNTIAVRVANGSGAGGGFGGGIRTAGGDSGADARPGGWNPASLRTALSTPKDAASAPIVCRRPTVRLVRVRKRAWSWLESSFIAQVRLGHDSSADARSIASKNASPSW